METTMSDQEKSQPNVRGEEPELNDDALEQVAGGCQVNSELQDTFGPPPFYPVLDSGIA
jgi:hypothetical protein